MLCSSSTIHEHQYGVELGHGAHSSSEETLALKGIHPRQWGLARKIWDTSLVVFLEFFTTMISTAGTPVAAHLHHDLGVSPVVATCIFVSIYLIGQTIGGVVFPPFSESFGRKKLYIISTAFYSLFCILIGKVPTIAGIVVGRFGSGFLSAIPTVIATGSIEDLWDTNARVWCMFCWALLANLGILAGPVFGELVTAKATWYVVDLSGLLVPRLIFSTREWVFYAAAIVTACVAILFFTIKESRPSVVLGHAKALDDLEGKGSKWHIPLSYEKFDIVRPLRLLFTEPIVFLVAFISAIAFGLIYLFTEVLPMVYQALGFTDGWQNAPFLALVIGMLLSVLTRFYDRRVLANADKPVSPESKFTGYLIGAPALAIGLWWFAWTIPPRVSVHWMIPTLALVPVGYAVNELDHVLAGYLSDCYETYTASSFAALALTRSLFCATFPLFGRILFDALDFNRASSLFAALATGLCIVPPMLVRHGAWLREKSKFVNK
ncbi:fluconazole resistance protein 1 [Colletotrichum orchidophilum]|uniref:Fluconazole resistance protein 1 n=1 Tax=Colletotrichum orchidophilum TaxID=1209926 RepID=A0A1G4AU45_9PEZI|nr:fluconazole resistance protein 1 [Colletotrichum orchidophilum]OHE92674.1 fluconazole resistance protein 1 [Colletotrichum orchidophilum]